ncbi:MAG: hypothetical protein ACRDK4_14630 [Solirubrobacteraceae bacterium]
MPLDQPAAISTDGNDLILSFGGATAEAGNEPYDPNRGGDVVVYRLSRATNGWNYRALTPPAVPYERSALIGISADADLSSTLWTVQTGSMAHKESMDLLSGDEQMREVGPAEIPELKDSAIELSEELTFVGASSDLSHSFYSITNEPASPNRRRDVWPGDTTKAEATSLYEYSYQGAPSVEPRLVGVKNQTMLDGHLHVNEGAELVSNCGTTLGSASGGSAYNSVSEDGETVFFTAKACEGSPSVNELYARVGAKRTVAISEPSKEDCEVCNTKASVKDASFVGASANGQQAFFMSEQGLLPGQESMSLYRYNFAAPPGSPSDPAGRISLVSTAARPEVQGVVRISEDGSHVYFVAKGLLAGANAEGRAPEPGADNLYLYEPDPSHADASRVVFIATLFTPAMEAEALEREEAVEGQALTEAVEFWEAHCPPAFSNFSCLGEVEAQLERAKSALGYFDVVETVNEDRSLWSTEDIHPAQATPDGRFLVFASSADLTPDDVSHVPQLFEYDATGGSLGQGSLTRVSIGQDGSYDSDGNVAAFSEAPQIPRQSFAFTDLPTAGQFGLAVSNDGSRIFFTSTAPLTPLAISGMPSLFEYTAGSVYLISDGKDASTTDAAPSVQLYGADPSSSDVFFTTADQLVPQAADTEQALYDAREEGGFPAPSLSAGCLGETCRGLNGGATIFPPVSTITQIGGATSDGLLAPTFRADRAGSGRHAATRARRLARALAACVKLSARRRRGCRLRARKRYG